MFQVSIMILSSQNFMLYGVKRQYAVHFLLIINNNLNQFSTYKNKEIETYAVL